MSERITDGSDNGGSTSTRALREFVATETAGALLLIVAVVVALAWANSGWRAGYESLWSTTFGLNLGRFELVDDLRHWVNDGLMTVFFLVVGLEVKRELSAGELRDRRKAAIPVLGALGGMAIPALLYFAFNPSGPASRGWGVPMATDIAFAVGLLALVARNAPSGVRVFLLTLAVVDDIGAVIVIALFYSDRLDYSWLAAAVAIVLIIEVAKRVGVADATPAFVVLGLGLWLATRGAGIHPSMAGIVMGVLAPGTPRLTREIVRSRTDELLDVFTPKTARETTRIARQSVSQLEWLEHQLHPWSSLLVLPLFALANAGIYFGGDLLENAATSPVTLGVVAGLVVGKVVGIGGAVWLATKFGVGRLPTDVSWRQLLGAAALGGIGFTVALFITGLAFTDAALADEARVGAVAASIVAAGIGAALLRTSRPATS